MVKHSGGVDIYLHMNTRMNERFLYTSIHVLTSQVVHEIYSNEILSVLLAYNIYNIGDFGL